MMKDYAKKSVNKEKPRRKKMGLSFFIIALAIILPALMFTVKYQKTKHPHKKMATIKQTTTPKKIQNKTTDFDFYTLLPKERD